MIRARRLIIIRQGDTELFEELRARFAGDPETLVVYDRRSGSRRRVKRQGVPERRRGERRLPHDPDILANRGFFVTRADRRRSAS
jgi:hypothetical protein